MGSFRGCLKQTQLQSKMEKQLPVRSIQVETCGVVHLLKGNFLKCNNSKFRLKTSELVKADNVVTFVHNVETFFLINERAQVHISWCSVVFYKHLCLSLVPWHVKHDDTDHKEINWSARRPWFYVLLFLSSCGFISFYFHLLFTFFTFWLGQRANSY